MTINQRFIEELFVRSEVRLAADIYKNYFNEIWICPDLFIRFLKSDGTQAQKALAITIAKQLADSADLTLPHSVFKGLANIEHQGDDQVHIAQDHVCHSINCYILGIYLAFNLPPIFRQLVRYFMKQAGSSNESLPSLEDALSMFIASWKMFAIYHDIGYILERSVDNKGFFKASSGISPDDLLVYSDTKKNVVYTTFMQSLARHLFTRCVFINSTDSVAYILSRRKYINSRHWFDIKTNATIETPADNVIKMLEEKADWVEINSICSLDGLRYIIPSPNSSKILTVISDSHLYPVCFLFQEEDRFEGYHVFTSSDQVKSIQNASNLKAIELEKAGLNCTYYIPSDSFVPILPSEISITTPQIQYLSEECYKKFAADFSIGFDEKGIQRLLFKIRDWLETQVPLSQFQSSYHDIINQEIGNTVLTNILCEMVTTILKANELSDDELDRQIDDLAIMLSNQLTSNKFRNELKDKYGWICNQDPDHNCRSVLGELVNIAFNSNLKKTADRRSIITISQPDSAESKIAITFTGFRPELFEGSKSTQVLLAKLKEKAFQMNISWNELLEYTPSYTTCDHGLVSSALFVECCSIYCSLMEKIGNQPFYIGTWKKTSFPTTDSEGFMLNRSVTEACFAILLHNIYAKSETCRYGVSYMQDITVNAFSYFSAFCDSLQFWDRPKLVNLGHTELPENTYFGRDFDLSIENNRIIISCKASRCKKALEQKFKDLDMYIKYASTLIEVFDVL